MDAMLITGNDLAAVQPLQGAAEALGFAVLHSLTTENVIEDVLLNDVAIVVTQLHSQPYDAWEVCALLRADPSIPSSVAIILMHNGDLDTRQLEKSGFTTALHADAPAAQWSDAIVKILTDSYNTRTGA